ncbi:TetR/AcrR family transcriptional regulator [Propionicicella superfundia]|uniref:TetR/AcrR family transcriptional regulator n=1 Tax=Propionicicella superfundia TaxID=348582 RepID=UPI00146EA93D|nr:TetR/AcrR family transcriptional regulator [Propionicicella superfundia]
MKLFWAHGYTATTIPMIAEKAGVAVGTVAKVGSKDELFLRVWEERSTEISLHLLAQAGVAAKSVTERVWSYLSLMLEATILMSDTIRDYLVAYLRASDHAANLERLDTVVTAIRKLLPEDDQGYDSPAQVAALTLWMTYSSFVFSLAANSCDAGDARRLLRSIVETTCAPFESQEPQ